MQTYIILVLLIPLYYPLFPLPLIPLFFPMRNPFTFDGSASLIGLLTRAWVRNYL